MTQNKPRIYLAGPMVFYPEPAQVFDRMKEICATCGFEGVAPLDNQMDLVGVKPGKDLILKIVQADFELMDKMDGGIFCLDPFRRSPEMDPGTAVEIGYMKALRKPMMGWTTDARDYPTKVRAYFERCFSLPLAQAQHHGAGGMSGALRDPDGMLVHSEGLLQNGMTQGGIELAGGEVFANPDWEKAFMNAARAMQKLIRLLA